MEKTKLEQPVPFEDIYFRRSEGAPSFIVLEKSVPMSDANYRHSRQVSDPEQDMSFVHLVERYSIAEQQSTQDDLDDVASHLGFGLLSDPGADRIMFWDDSEDTLKWLDYADELVIFNEKLSVDHDLCTNFVANEHIDHTSVTLTAGTALSGGGDISASRTFDVEVEDENLILAKEAFG